MRADIDERLQTWVGDGLITADQADAIRASEARSGRTDARSTLAAEAVGYLGAALAVVAGGLVVGRYWDRISGWGRISLALTLTLATLAAGWWIRERPGAAVGRLVSLLWVAAVVGTAFTSVLVCTEVLDVGEAATGLVAGAAVSAVAGWLYALRPRALQQLALLAGLVTITQAALSLPSAEVDLLFRGLTLWGLGVAWALGADGGWVVPATTGLAGGGIVTGIGLQMATGGPYRGWGLGLALLTTAAVGAASVIRRRTLLLGFAVAGTFLFVPQTVFHFFGDSLGAPFALFLTGLLLVGAAVGSLRLRHDLGDPD